MDIDKSLEGIYDPALIDKYKGQANASFEERVVKKILTKLGKADEIKEMLYAVKETTGKPKLSFSYFHSVYPSFPIWLSIKNIGYVYQTSVPDFFNKFEDTKILAAWSEACDEAPGNVPVGLVFDFMSIKGRQLICHNLNTDNTDGQVRICKAVNTQLISIERFEPFLDQILSVWAPH